MSTSFLRALPGRALVRIGAAGSLVLALSCGGGGEMTGVKVGPPASLQIVSGEDQSLVVGRELPDPLRVKVTDAAGQAVAGQLVNFRVTVGGGSMFAGSAITTSEGIAVDRWTLGPTAGAQSVEARAVDPNTGAALVFATFHATAAADVPAAIAKVGGDGQTGVAGGALPTPLTVRVTDRFGNPVPGAAVAFAAPAGGGSAAPSTVPTDAAGMAGATWTLGSVAGGQQVAVSSGAAPAQTFIATALAGPATSLVLATPADGARSNVAFTTQPVVRVADSFGNVVTASTAPVTLSVSAGAAVLGTATATAASGVASFSGVGLSGPAGSYTLSYSAPLGAGGASVTQSIALSVGAPAALVFAAQPPATAEAGAAFSSAPAVQLVDANGAPVGQAGVSVALSATPSGATLAGVTSVTTDASGRATLVGARLDGLVGSYRLTAASAGLASATSDPIALSAGPATQLSFVQQVAGAGRQAVIAPAVTVAMRDQFGNLATAATSPVSLSIATNPNGAVLSGGGAVTPVNGIASFGTLMLDRGGSGYVLRAAMGTLSALGTSFEVSDTATVVVAPASLDGVAGVAVGKIAVSGGTLAYQLTAGNFQSWVYTVPTTGGTPTPRVGPQATNQTSLASSGGTPYFMYRYPSANTQGCFITGISGLLRYCEPRIAVEGAFAYVYTTSYSEFGGFQETAIRRVAIPGGALTIPVTGALLQRGFAVDNGLLYFADLGTHSISRVPVTGGSPTVIASISQEVTEMVVAGGVVYWLEGPLGGVTSLRSAPVGGGTPVVRASGLAAGTHSLVADGAVLYLIQGDTYSTATSSYTGGSLMRYLVSDFSVTQVATQAEDVALDAGSVYWSSRATPSSVKKAPK